MSRRNEAIIRLRAFLIEKAELQAFLPAVQHGTSLADRVVGQTALTREW